MTGDDAGQGARAPSGIDDVLARNLKRVRNARGISLSSLARTSGLARATLYQMEAGSGNPTIDTIWSVSNALKVPLSELLTEAEPPAVQVIRAESGPNVVGETLVARLLRRFRLNHNVLELLHLTVEPGIATPGHTHPSGVHEHVLVIQGELSTGPVGQAVTLGPGDYASFPADVPHSYQALSAAPVLAALIMEYPATMDLHHSAVQH
ncbi:XRE family transcriptional regulator [Nocardioides sp. LHD-245]|uniref:helix-turn-helix domain-containing protein n=1 Tax=Nocardioides sp. LHD-245 TaxID=3051387 RepID=UPI0027E1A062|nr:XRE family transcriptional regulator [Nocardioides sp. LHD-245]